MLVLGGPGYLVGDPSDDGLLTIGGRCSLAGAFSPNNGLPLTQFARVRLSDGEYVIPGWQRPDIHFLYSWKCLIHEGDFSYNYKNDEINIIEYKKGRDDSNDFPYENYPVIFDEVHFKLRQLSSEDQAVILELNKADCDWDYEVLHDRLTIPVHQFGGTPYVVNIPEEKNCPICSAAMPVIASIANKSYTNKQGFVDNDFVQVVYWACASCSVISARNYSD